MFHEPGIMIAAITSQMFHGYGVMVFPLQRLDVYNIYIYVHCVYCYCFRLFVLAIAFPESLMICAIPTLETTKLSCTCH